MNCDFKASKMKTSRLATTLACSALLGMINAHGAKAAQITAENLRTLQLNKQVSIIDVRPPSDFAAGHIQGARNIAAVDVSKAGLDKGTAGTIYCYDNTHENRKINQQTIFVGTGGSLAHSRISEILSIDLRRDFRSFFHAQRWCVVFQDKSPSMSTVQHPALK